MTDQKQKPTALVPFMQAQAPMKVTPPDKAALARIQEDYAKELCEYVDASATNELFTAQFSLLTIGVPFLFIIPEVALVFAIGSIFFGGINTVIRNEMTYQAAATHRNARCSLVKAFVDAQKNPREALFGAMLAAAQDHIAKGNVLSARDIAWLASMPGNRLAGASDELAITILQARKLIAHACAQKTGDKTVHRPLTFAALHFNPAFPQLRAELRAKLMQDDLSIDEQKEPEYKKPVFGPEPDFHSSLLKHFLSGYIAPLANAYERRKWERVKIDAHFPEVQVPLPQQAEDFESILEAFERENAPLDLPAMRGWEPRKRKGPKLLTFK